MHSRDSDSFVFLDPSAGLMNLDLEFNRSCFKVCLLLFLCVIFHKKKLKEIYMAMKINESFA